MIAVGLILALVAYLTFNAVEEQIYINSPISSILTSELIVPDFYVGEIPNVQYYRNIKKEFIGNFSVEIKNAENAITQCHGEGNNIRYSLGEEHREPITLDWYVNKECSSDLSIGQYFVETNYTIRIESLPDRFLKTVSNIFSVTDPDAPVHQTLG